MELFGATHPVKIEEFLAYDGVIVEDLVEFTQLEEEDLFKVVLLDLPVLTHGRGEGLPLLVRDVQGRRVVVRVI